MNTTLILLDEAVLVKVAGVVDSRSAGPLCDSLARAIRSDKSRLVIDVSGVSGMTRAGVRGMIVAAHMLRCVGGETRICGAHPAARRLLENLGHDQLFVFDEPVPAVRQTLNPGLLDGARRFTAQPPQPVGHAANRHWPISA